MEIHFKVYYAAMIIFIMLKEKIKSNRICTIITTLLRIQCDGFQDMPTDSLLCLPFEEGSLIFLLLNVSAI